MEVLAGSLKRPFADRRGL